MYHLRISVFNTAGAAAAALSYLTCDLLCWQVAVYSELNFTQAVNDVKFHPLDHIVAFSSRGDNHKVLVFRYEYNQAEREAKNYFTLVPASRSAAAASNTAAAAASDK